MPIGNGGIIGPANVPTITTASGVWSLREQQQAQGRGAWPLAIAPDPYFEYTTLLLPSNGTNGANNNTFLDGSTNNFTITRNGNTTQGTFSPFSQTGWGNYFSGSNYIYISNNSVFDLSGDFTIEFWWYPLTLSATTQSVCGKWGASQFAWLVQATSTSLTLQTGPAPQTTITNSWSPVNGRWYHIAFTRSGTDVRAFVNGSQIGTTQTSSKTCTSTANMGIGANPDGPQEYSNGYISNLRITKGQAFFTGNFNPATSPLTTSTVGATGSGVPTQTITGTVSILTCQSNRFIDNSTNNFTITRGGDPSVVAFSPFNPTSAWSASTVGGSGYFDGSGDYLSAPNSTNLDVGTGDFSIEAWCYKTNTSTATDWRVTGGSASSSGFFGDGGTTSSRGFGIGRTGVAWDVTSNVQAPIYEWFHICYTRKSGDVRIFLNGKLIAYAAGNTNNYGLNAGTLQIAAGQGGQLLTGYMTGFRLFKTVPASYDTTVTTINTQVFTPPTSPPTAITNTQLLLNFTNAGIYDATSKNDLETVGNAQISTTQSKWGGSSISFDGTGDWLLIPDQPPQRIGTGNFTVEMWVYRNSSGTYGLAGKGTGTTGWLLSLNSSNQVVFTYGSSTITSSGTVSATTWTHIAVVREGTSTNQTKIYISGTNDGTGTVSTDFNQTNSMYIGADRTGGSAANAYVQDVRITNYARYTANFTAPTAAFPTL